MSGEEFSIYVRQTSRKLYAFAYRILRNQEEAEDAVQEVFIKLWHLGNKLDTYRCIDALATTMIRNHCIDIVRKKRPSFTDSYDDDQINSDVSPLEQMVKAETQDIIRKIIDRMPELYRNILIMRDIQGLEYDEIAEKTNQNVNTLRVNLSRARSLLRDEYRKKYDE
jgi:RNA polymerase sigma-70 factor (ECF subfamily)